ncbi:mandelate racemase/muconate lactonizing enzyme family protein [Protaetiibacter mangrovi]|uniref:Mandelate racemase n=1 Tax=Protaetiibacter mangrovi TaxID=2970926 RepID=A0ABT1ZGS6_9MICO|nr:enolase C-terminal domain-like protein [Protaetiibacter mangrovi]MCS0499919.1 mandelate racemase [Protaetiibacter mangrovi]
MVRNIGRNALRDTNGSGRDLVVVVVRTDRGAEGWGHAGAGALGEVVGAERLGEVIGRSVAELIDPERGVVHPTARALDIPLHDLAGRILGVPVYAMLGARGRREVPCYSGGIYFDDLDPQGMPEGLAAVRRNLAMDWELGYRDFKLKVGRGRRWMPPGPGMARDIEVTRLARESYPESRLMVDANDGFSLTDVGRYLDAVADCGLYWLEEPFVESVPDFVRLRRILVDGDHPTLIADGEMRPDQSLIVELAGAGLLDIALMDVFGFGFSRWRWIMPRLRLAGVLGSPHTWGSPLKMYYAAHLAAGLGNIPTIEGMPGSVEKVDSGGHHFENGVLTVSDEPGFGLRISS